MFYDDVRCESDDLRDRVADLSGGEVLAGETPEGPGDDALLCGFTGTES